MDKKTPPESLESLIYSRAGDVFSGNSDLENAASAYGSAAEFSKSPYNMEKAAIAYYRLAKSLGSAQNAKGYADKAETLFQRAAYVDPARIDSHYYLGMIYSERGDINKAASEFSMIYEKADEISDRAVMSLIESYIFIKEARYQKESEAYSMLEDPFLASFYEFVKKYAIGSDVESGLKDKHGTDNPYSALAMEINGLYKRYFMDEGMRKRIPNPVSRFAVMISAMFGKDGSGEGAAAIFSKPESVDLRKLPPYTRGIVTDFLSRFGLTPNSFKMPYMIQKDIRTVERLMALISELREESLDKGGIRRRLAELMDFLPANLRQSYLGFFESLEFKSFDEIYNGLSKLRLELLESIFKRLRAFYPKTETSRLFRLIVSSLRMKEEDKMRIIDRMNYID
jgi:tetratricopeptide (TPR) repeat protein